MCAGCPPGQRQVAHHSHARTPTPFPTLILFPVLQVHLSLAREDQAALGRAAKDMDIKRLALNPDEAAKGEQRQLVTEFYMRCAELKVRAGKEACTDAGILAQKPQIVALRSGALCHVMRQLHCASFSSGFLELGHACERG